MRASKVPGLVTPEADVCVTGDSTCPDDHSSVLDRTVWIQESCANHCYFRSHRVAYHFTQPAIVDYFHVIVEQCDERSPRDFDATIIQATIVESIFDPLHPDTLSFFQRGQKFQGFGIAALVIE